MKKFIKERNAFLLVSFVISIAVLLIIVVAFKSHFDLVENLMTGSREYYVDLALISFYTILFVLFVLISLFNMVGFLYKKDEYIFISIGLLVVLLFLHAFGGYIELFIITIIWCMINVIGLMKNKSN